MNESVKAFLDIGTLGSLTGFNTSTIRTWETRYKILTPSKAENGRRLYSQRDVDRLILIRDLLDRGHKISSLVDLSNGDLLDLLARTDPSPPPESRSNLYDDLIASIDRYDVARFRRMLTYCVAELSPHDAVVQIFLPILRLIGERWHAGILDVGQEHMLSEVIRARLMSLIDGLKVAENGPLVAFATLSREAHEFGALMACFLASSQRYRTIYFGSNMPAADLALNVRRMAIRLIVLSSIYVSDANSAEISELAALVDDSVSIWLGCDPAKFPTHCEIPHNVSLIANMALLESRLGAFSSA